MLLSITIFLSAFLLFQIQPIIARFILPWYGGHSGIWTTCMLFFQVSLLLGYSYAYFLAKYFKARQQILIHALLLAVSLLFLPVIPADTLKPTGIGDPVWSILKLLALTVGVPFVMTAATGPLMQHWFSRSHPAGEPYRMYAI